MVLLLVAAAGKSTFIELIALELNASIVPEPLSDWTNLQGKGQGRIGANLLAEFYADPKKWAYTC